MITSITAKNFRSIEETQDIALGPITVLYGPTSSGKSSILYGALALRNFVLNPNRQADGLFHLGFMDLGGFDACVFNHDQARNITLAVNSNGDGQSNCYEMALGKNCANLRLKAGQFEMQAKVSIPYGLNQSFPFAYTEGSEEYNVNWNGIACTVTSKKPTTESQQQAQQLAVRVNSAAEVLKGIDIAPHRRGFFKPNYTPVSVSPSPTTEDEVASLIINDQHMAGRISTYTEEIFDRDFRIHTPPGTATAFFQTTDKKSRTPVFLVNEGFGINQVIYLLAKMHRVDTRMLFIEEPEVHLHPTVIRKFARALCTFVKEEGKQLVLTTHSEQFLVSLLTAVSEGLIGADDFHCYLASKERRRTTFHQQKVQKNGQVEGGLASFIEAEIEDLKKCFSVK